MLKRVKIALWISLPIAVLVVGILSIQHNMDKPVQKLNVDIDYRENGSTNRFLTYEDVNTFIAHRYDSIVGKPVDKVNIEQMEKDLMVIPYIKSVDAYTTLDATIQLRIIQRRAIVRISDVFGDQFYMDDEARLLPIRTSFPARVPVCNGNIKSVGFYTKNYKPTQWDSIVQHTILKDIYAIAKHIDTDSLLKVQIVQMYVTPSHEFILVPLVSNHIIEFGKAENIAEKFDKLKIFYKEGLGHNAWNDYKKINLKYKNQIVCTKI
jgi:cell division protein FtsQ